jgi:hypothetical protein
MTTTERSMVRLIIQDVAERYVNLCRQMLYEVRISLDQQTIPFGVTERTWFMVRHHFLALSRKVS